MARNQFGGFGGPNMQQLMRQAQKMQQQMEQAQAELDAKEYEASAGGGMLTGTARGMLKAGATNTQFVAASIDLTGLSMASDIQFNKKSCTTGIDDARFLKDGQEFGSLLQRIPHHQSVPISFSFAHLLRLIACKQVHQINYMHILYRSCTQR